MPIKDLTPIDQVTLVLIRQCKQVTMDDRSAEVAQGMLLELGGVQTGSATPTQS